MKFFFIYTHLSITVNSRRSHKKLSEVFPALCSKEATLPPVTRSHTASSALRSHYLLTGHRPGSFAWPLYIPLAYWRSSLDIVAALFPSDYDAVLGGNCVALLPGKITALLLQRLAALLLRHRTALHSTPSQGSDTPYYHHYHCTLAESLVAYLSHYSRRWLRWPYFQSTLEVLTSNTLIF